MKLSLGFSTCPNDTFIFDAMVHNKIDTEGLSFDLLLADVEELNKKAFSNKIDITKISFHAYAKISDNYKILNSGSALGNNNGPLLISKRKIYLDEINDLHIAIPGVNTTANLLLNIAFPDIKKKTEYIFSDIEESILSNEVDAGLIIHETRFTYQKKGLLKILDLGEYWEKTVNLPIPLGGIIISNKLSEDIHKKVDRVLKKSIEFAFNNPNESYKFVKQYAQEMDIEVMKKHINLYVNDYTKDLGDFGKKAISELYKKAIDKNVINYINKDIFVKNNL